MMSYESYVISCIGITFTNWFVLVADFWRQGTNWFALARGGWKLPELMTFLQFWYWENLSGGSDNLGLLWSTGSRFLPCISGGFLLKGRRSSWWFWPMRQHHYLFVCSLQSAGHQDCLEFGSRSYATTEYLLSVWEAAAARALLFLFAFQLLKSNALLSIHIFFCVWYEKGPATIWYNPITT